MFHNSLLFVIVSQNNEIENVLRNIAPLEDCGYIFKTIPADGRTDPEIRFIPDTAVIRDCLMGQPYGVEIRGTSENVAVFAADSPELVKAQNVSELSDIWVMPKGSYDAELLTAYFMRLAARMKKTADDRKQDICFQTLINSVPNIAWFKDTEGAHLMVNDSFCEMVGKTKKQIYKQGHCYIWDASKQDEEVCLSSDRIIMESRKTNTFEEVVKTKTDLRMLKSYKSALIDSDGEIFGTCGIAHDVTEFKNISTEFNMILDNVPFAVLLENTEEIVVNKNIQFDEYFPEFFNIIGKSSAAWKKSLVTKKLPGGKLTEVTVRYDKHERILLLEEEPMQDFFHRTIGKVITLTDMTAERNISKRNEYRANTDFLTDLNNRRSLENHLKKVCKNGHIAVIMVDLDNFKQVNDTLGHDAGDKALIVTSHLLKESFENDFISRMGGDEFVIIASEQSEDQIKQKAQKMLDKMRGAENKHKELKNVTASIGIVFSDSIPQENRKNPEKLQQMTDEQLYRAKKSGKNRCCVYGE